MGNENCSRCGAGPFGCNCAKWEQCEDCGGYINWGFFHTCTKCSSKRAEKRITEEKTRDKELFQRFLANLYKGNVIVEWVPNALPKYRRGVTGGPNYSSYSWWIGPLHLTYILEETRNTYHL